jgi:hypothetical protein
VNEGRKEGMNERNELAELQCEVKEGKGCGEQSRCRAKRERKRGRMVILG